MDLEITLKAIANLPTTDPALLANAGLERENKIHMRYRFYNAQNQNPPGANPGIYIPLKAEVYLNGESLDGLINDQSGPSVTGSCYVADNTFNWYDHVGFHYRTRDVIGNHPFAALDRIQFEYRIDEGARSGVDLPDPGELQLYQQNFLGSYLAFTALTGGTLGNGLDWIYAPTSEVEINIEQI